jgi:TonB family protein
VPQTGLSRRAQLESRLARRYPDSARRLDIEGVVRLLVEVRSNGTVRNVRVITDPGGGLGEAAVEELRSARFRPALDRRGRAVDTRIVYTVRYVLEA